jgi:hypothetical protein
MMTLPIPFGTIDERFLAHRLKSTSLAGILGALVAVGLWTYEYTVRGVWRWDLFAVVMTMVGVKVAAMVWYRLTD